MCNTCGCKSAESFEAETWGVQIYDTDLTMADVKKMLKEAGIKTKGSVRKIGNGYGYYFKFDSSHQSKFEKAFKKFGKAGNYEYEAESFEAETFEAREDLICDYCEKIISPNEGSVNWPDSGLIVCDDCFDDAIKNAESFDAQTKLTAFTRGKDWEGKPYTGQIFPDHPDLDPKLADRNKDGKMASWERAIGNQVAKGKSRFKAPRKMIKTTTKFTQRKPITAASSLVPYAIAVGALATILGLRGKE